MITDWIMAVAAVVSTCTAVVTAYLAYNQYLKSPEQETEPDSPEAGSEETSLSELKVFQTSKQRTVLRVTELGLECHLHDERPNKGGHQWTLSPAQVAEVIKKRDYHVNPGFKARSGTFSIGRYRNWLYSKSLFPEPEYLHGALSSLLEQAGK